METQTEAAAAAAETGCNWRCCIEASLGIWPPLLHCFKLQLSWVFII